MKSSLEYFCTKLRVCIEEDYAKIAKYNKLKSAIEKHRAQTGHNMCWQNDEELWAALDDGVKIDHTPPPWCEFMQKCAEYRKSLERPEVDPSIPIERG